MQTGPNSHIIYTVAWKERWINGQATLQTGDHTTTVPYRVRNGLTFEIQGVEDVGCGSIMLQE